jgi:hypothetical protein
MLSPFDSIISVLGFTVHYFLIAPIFLILSSIFLPCHSSFFELNMVRTLAAGCF